MNKRLLILALFLPFAFGSCTQEFICQCEISYEGDQPGLPNPVIQEFFIKDTRKQAAINCEENSTSYTSSDSITLIQACQLF
jgi:hypothetical protein